MSERDGVIPDVETEPMREASVVWFDLDATLTDDVFRSVDDIPAPSEEGLRALKDAQKEGLAAGVYTGRVFAADPVVRSGQVARVERWIDDNGLRALLPAGVWPWPKPYAKAFVDDRGVTWRGHAGPRLMAEIRRADQHCRRKPRVLLVSPLSDRYNGIGNYGAPALGVWRLRANMIAKGVDCDAWDCNTEPDVPACSKVDDLVRAFADRLKARFDPGAYDWIGFSILNDTLPLTLGLANLLKREFPKVRQIAGNAEATLNYQDVLDKTWIDCVLVGEADHSFPLLAYGEDPRRVDGVIWFNRATRMTPEQFNRAYEALDWGAVPWHEYWRRTAELYHGPACPKGNGTGACDCGTYRPYLDKWLADGDVDPALLPAGIDAKAGARKLLSICTVRLVTMDHCFLPCTYCLDGRTLIRTEHGLEEIQSIVARGERVRVMQHDGTLGLATEFHRRPYSGPMIRIDVSGNPTPLFLTPDHGVRVDDGRSRPARELRQGDRVLGVARGFAAGAETTVEHLTVREVGEAYLTDGEVFNLGVEPLHTYVADGIAVDNCSTARIPDFATGAFQRSVFLGIDAVKHLLKKIKREVRGVLTIYDDSDETFLGTQRGLDYAQALIDIKPEMDEGTLGRGMSYLVQTRSNEMTRELVEKLARAGVRHLTFGVENASAYVRDSLRKRQDDQKLLDLIDWCVEFKVTPYYLMILFPPETRVEDVEINVRVVAEWIRRGAVVSAEPYLMPYRGTPILDDPRYTYEHVTFDVPYSGTPGKKLKWPTLIWPRDPAVRGILLAYRATLDDAIRKARETTGTEHTFKGWVGKVAIEHLARVLQAFHDGVVKPWGGEDAGVGQVSPVLQEYFGQESGINVRDRERQKIEASMQGTRFNPSLKKFTTASGITSPENGTSTAVSELKQGGIKSIDQKNPAIPEERILDGQM